MKAAIEWQAVETKRPQVSANKNPIMKRQSKRPISPNEANRVAALARYDLLDTPPEAAFDAITQAAAALCETPIALISLIDQNREWCKACIGLDMQEASRYGTFCSYAILTPAEFMGVEDAALDPRFLDDPLVTRAPNIRFYAGQPLVTPDGFAIGALCVLDRKPRKLSVPQREALIKLTTGVMALFEDRRKSISREQLAAESVTGLGEVLEASVNEIYMIDESTLHFVHANQGARNNLGYSLEEMSEMTPVDIQPEFTREKFEQLLAPLRDNMKSKIGFTTVYQRKNSSTYPVEVHLQCSLYDSKPVFAAIVLDITERTQTEDALAQSRLFLESAPDASVIVNGTGTIEVANSRMTTLFGYAPNEFRGMPIEQLIPKRFRGGHVAHRKVFNADAKIRDMGADLELFALTKDDREFPIEVSLSPIQTSDGLLVAAAIRDITARKEIAEALQHAKEAAESATATKSRFLAAASHDLRQPLQSIGIYLSVLKRSLEKPQNLDISNKIRNSLDVMGELLDALLDISKLDSGSIVPAKKDFSTQKLLDQLMADNEPHAKEKKLAFRCIGAPCVIHSDPALLQRIVENFVSNAIRYTESGTVEVLCECIDDHARIAIRDSGAGIPEDALATIFEEYFQLDNPVRDRRKGLGLGLSIVKHIARLLDHRLEVISACGKGSTFAVYVPLGQAIALPVEEHALASKPRHTDRPPIVLLVDDDPAIVDATTMLLDDFGYEVHSALNDGEALAHLALGIRPDIIVSDYRLPGYNGVEVVRRVRHATSDDLPTVLMTGDTSAQEIRAANLTRCTVLHKPVDTDQLISLIEQLTA